MRASVDTRPSTKRDTRDTRSRRWTGTGRHRARPRGERPRPSPCLSHSVAGVDGEGGAHDQVEGLPRGAGRPSAQRRQQPGISAESRGPRRPQPARSRPAPALPPGAPSPLPALHAPLTRPPARPPRPPARPPAACLRGSQGEGRGGGTLPMKRRCVSPSAAASSPAISRSCHPPAGPSAGPSVGPSFVRMTAPPHPPGPPAGPRAALARCASGPVTVP